MLKYRSEIDGLRAVAVVPVILFHAGFELFSGGFTGVDVFFVISGYLITSIIIKELDQGTFSIGKFYERRVRRILPALFLVILCSIPFAWAWMIPIDFKNFSQSIVAAIFFSSNILFWRQSGYFASAAEEKPLLHTWSLAVEEQYYVIFPIFLLLMWRFGSRQVFYSIIAIATMSLALAEWGWRFEPNANFYLAPTRAWELLAGSICAFVQFKRGQDHSEILSAIGLALILFGILFYDESTPFPSWFALAPVVGTSLIILYGSHSTWTAKVLSTRVFVGIGLISYSAYLWHQPLFAFARIRSLYPPDQSVLIALAVASLVLAYLSWRFVEQPFRRKPAPVLPGRRIIFSASAILAAIFTVFGLYGHFTNGQEERWLASVSPKTAATYKLIYDAKKIHRQRERDDGNCRFTAQALTESHRRRILDCKQRYGRGYAIIGDSHGLDLFNAINANTDTRFVVGLVKDDCRPYDPLPNCHFDGVRDFVQSHPSAFAAIIYHQAGFHLLTDSFSRVGDRDMFSSVPMDDEVPMFSVNKGHVELVHRYLLYLSRYTNVRWFGPRTEPHISEKFALKAGCDYEFKIRKGQQEVFSKLDSYLDGLVSESKVDSKLEYVSQVSLTNLTFPEDFMNCERTLWSDGDHWSSAGYIRFGQRFVDKLIR